MKHNASSKKAKLFLSKIMFAIKLWLDKEISRGNYMFHLQNKAFKICCHWIFLQVSGLWLDLDWIDNHIFAMDLDWIDNPKKLDWATAWVCDAVFIVSSEIKLS